MQQYKANVLFMILGMIIASNFTLRIPAVQLEVITISFTFYAFTGLFLQWKATKDTKNFKKSMLTSLLPFIVVLLITFALIALLTAFYANVTTNAIVNNGLTILLTAVAIALLDILTEALDNYIKQK